MVQYERFWRVTEETDLIPLVFCHPAECWCGCWWPGGQTECPCKPAVSANTLSAEGNANLEKI